MVPIHYGFAVGTYFGFAIFKRIGTVVLGFDDDGIGACIGVPYFAILDDAVQAISRCIGAIVVNEYVVEYGFLFVDDYPFVVFFEDAQFALAVWCRVGAGGGEEEEEKDEGVFHD